MNKNKIALFAFVFVLTFTMYPAPSHADNQSCTGNGGQCILATDSCGSNAAANAGFTCGGTDQCCMPTSGGGGGTGSGGAGSGTAAASTKGQQYQLLEKIPGTDGLGSDLPGYVSALYKVALVIVTLSAVLMLTVGGFMYLTSAGNTASMGNAKGIIVDALIGLVIALAAWLILYIINPDLVKITLSGITPPTPTSAPAASPGKIGALPSGSDSELAKQILDSGSISLPQSGECSSVTGPVSPFKNIGDIADGKRASVCSNGCKSKGSSGCTDNQKGLSNRMLAAIVAVGKVHTFTIQSIAGGSHSNTSAHFSGNAIDVTPVNQALMDAFVKAGAFPPKGNSASMCEKGITGADGVTKATSVDCTTGGANHIHLIFPN